MHCYLFSHRELVNPYLLISFRFALKVLIHTRNFFIFSGQKLKMLNLSLKFFASFLVTSTIAASARSTSTTPALSGSFSLLLFGFIIIL